MKKPENLENPEKIKQFLDTVQGRKVFREITSDFTKADRSNFKKNLIDPKPATRKRLNARDKLILKINE